MELIMFQANVSRGKAVKASKNNANDIIKLLFNFHCKFYC